MRISTRHQIQNSVLLTKLGYTYCFSKAPIKLSLWRDVLEFSQTRFHYCHKPFESVYIIFIPVPQLPNSIYFPSNHSTLIKEKFYFLEGIGPLNLYITLFLTWHLGYDFLLLFILLYKYCVGKRE